MAEFLLIVTEDGFGKRVAVDEVRRTKRDARGVTVSRGRVALALVVDDGDDAELVLGTAAGKVERIAVGSISGRRRSSTSGGRRGGSRGVRLMRLDPGDRVASGTLVGIQETAPKPLAPLDLVPGMDLALKPGESLCTRSMVRFSTLRPIADIEAGGSLAVDAEEWAAGDVHAHSAYWCSHCGRRHADPEAVYACIDGHVRDSRLAMAA